MPTETSFPYDPRVAWREDRRRYPRRAFLREPSIWAVAVFRLGQIAEVEGGLRYLIMRRLYWPLQRATELATGISLPKNAVVGSGLRIHHFGNVVIHPGAHIGANCTLRQGVTVGERREGAGLPVLGNDVEVGAHACILGSIRVGHNVKIGALALVIEDIPDGGVAYGAKATVKAPSELLREETSHE